MACTPARVQGLHAECKEPDVRHAQDVCSVMTVHQPRQFGCACGCTLSSMRKLGRHGSELPAWHALPKRSSGLLVARMMRSTSLAATPAMSSARCEAAAAC